MRWWPPRPRRRNAAPDRERRSGPGPGLLTSRREPAVTEYPSSTVATAIGMISAQAHCTMDKAETKLRDRVCNPGRAGRGHGHRCSGAAHPIRLTRHDPPEESDGGGSCQRRTVAQSLAAATVRLGPPPATDSRHASRPVQIWGLGRVVKAKSRLLKKTSPSRR